MQFQSQKNRFFVLLLILLISSVFNHAQDAPFKGLDDYVNKALKDWEVPGVAIAVVKDDKIVFAKGYGVRELGKTDPVTPNTIFAAGSTTKAFTSAALAILVDEGKLKWDDRATKYLPNFQLYDPYVTHELTVRDLLSHRIGLERGNGLFWYETALDREEILRRARFLKPTSSFRSRFSYNNVMYLAAGQIVPSVTKMTWDDFLRERIFQPLGMNSTNTSIRDLRNVKDLAMPHALINGKVQPIAYRSIDNLGPAGSINSNVIDLAQWIRLQLGDGKFGGKQIISQRNIKEMQFPNTTMRIQGLLTSVYSESHFLNYGMGWFLSDYRGRKMVEHGGAVDGMKAQITMIPEENLGVVVLSNINFLDMAQMLANRIVDMYLVPGKERDWSGEVLKARKVLETADKAAADKREAERVKNTKPSLTLEKYAGNYTDELYGDVKIRFENGALKAKFGLNNGTLEHWQYDVFRIKWQDEILGESLINFRLDSQGKVEAMRLEMSYIGEVADFNRVAVKD